MTSMLAVPGRPAPVGAPNVGKTTAGGMPAPASAGLPGAPQGAAALSASSPAFQRTPTPEGGPSIGKPGGQQMDPARLQRMRELGVLDGSRMATQGGAPQNGSDPRMGWQGPYASRDPRMLEATRAAQAYRDTGMSEAMRARQASDPRMQAPDPQTLEAMRARMLAARQAGADPRMAQGMQSPQAAGPDPRTPDAMRQRQVDPRLMQAIMAPQGGADPRMSAAMGARQVDPRVIQAMMAQQAGASPGMPGAMQDPKQLAGLRAPPGSPAAAQQLDPRMLERMQQIEAMRRR